MYTEQQLTRALELQRRLVAAGLDPEYSSLRVKQRMDDLESRTAEELAPFILAGAPEKFKTPPPEKEEVGKLQDEDYRRAVERTAHYDVI